MVNMKIHKFKAIIAARRRAMMIQQRFGFKPAVFKVRNPRTGRVNFVVVQARGMKRVR